MLLLSLLLAPALFHLCAAQKPFGGEVSHRQVTVGKNIEDIDDFNCPARDLETKCAVFKECLHADPTSCLSFYQCIISEDGKVATPYRHDCPGGLLWNDDAKVCDWPNAVKCNL